MDDTELTARLFADGAEPKPDPFDLFDAWLATAATTEPNDPDAMALATVDQDGLPDCRMVLFKGRQGAGITFFTNLESGKGGQLKAHPRAALCFHWKSQRRQIRFRGSVSEVSAQSADAYFASRARASRIGARASEQSRPLASRELLKQRVAEIERQFPEPSAVPRPDNWSGFRLEPVMVEFWQDGAHRLHDRVRYTRDSADSWSAQRLYP